MTGRDLPPHEQGLLVLASQFPWTSHGDDPAPSQGEVAGGLRRARHRARRVVGALSARCLSDPCGVKTPGPCLAARHGHRLPELLHPSAAGRAAQSQPGRRPCPRPLLPTPGSGYTEHAYLQHRTCSFNCRSRSRRAREGGRPRGVPPLEPPSTAQASPPTQCRAGEGSGLLDGAPEQPQGKVWCGGVRPQQRAPQAEVWPGRLPGQAGRGAGRRAA